MKYIRYMLAAAIVAAAAFGTIPAAGAEEPLVGDFTSRVERPLIHDLTSTEERPLIRDITSTGEGLVITWDLLENADVYGIFRKAGDGAWKCIAKVPAEEVIPEPETLPEEEAGAEPETLPAEEAIPEPETDASVIIGTWTDSLIIPGEEYRYFVRGYNSRTHQWSKAEESGTAAIWDVTPGQITAGTVLTEEAVETFGADAFFYTEEISDETFARMWGKSFKEYCTMDRADLRYIRCLHKDIDGNIKAGELVMHAVVADAVCWIFRQLYDAAYPIESMILVDEFDADDETSIMSNNTSAFNFRMVDSTDQISNHAYGLAIDINPYYNVYYIPSENYIFPPEGWEYLDREADFPYKLMPGDLCYNLFTAAGFEWGGWWTYNTDYQHFQYIY